MPTQAKLDRALAALEAAQENVRTIVEQLKRFPVEPAEGTVLRFEKQFDHGGQRYTYVAYRGPIEWHLTGCRAGDRGRMGWSRLTEFIGDAAVSIASAFQPFGPGSVRYARDEDGWIYRYDGAKLTFVTDEGDVRRDSCRKTMDEYLATDGRTCKAVELSPEQVPGWGR